MEGQVVLRLVIGQVSYGRGRNGKHGVPIRGQVYQDRVLSDRSEAWKLLAKQAVLKVSNDNYLA